MQLDFWSRWISDTVRRLDVLTVGTRAVPLRFFRNRLARRYVLRVKPDGSARITIPRGGTQKEARLFVERNMAWIEQQLLKQQARVRPPQVLVPGAEIMFRGLPVTLEMSADGRSVCFADQCVGLGSAAGDLRPLIERHLRQLAAGELVSRTWELARLCGLVAPDNALETVGRPPPLRLVHRVSVRNQRSRWGSCSVRGTVSLNWRLIQVPEWVRDYLILHELMHLREMNHSRRFWREVERLCPQYAAAEKWLKQHGALLR